MIEYIKQRIEELKAERDRIHADAQQRLNNEIAPYNAAISELEKLLAEIEKEEKTEAI